MRPTLPLAAGQGGAEASFPPLTQDLPHGQVGLQEALLDGCQHVLIVVRPEGSEAHYIVHEVILSEVRRLLPAVAVEDPEEGILDVLLVVGPLVGHLELIFHILPVTLV